MQMNRPSFLFYLMKLLYEMGDKTEIVLFIPVSNIHLLKTSKYVSRCFVYA